MLDLATWGDDYQLLFTAAPESREKLLRDAQSQGIRISRIGGIRAGQGLAVISQSAPVNLPETIGFEHGGIGLFATRP